MSAVAITLLTVGSQGDDPYWEAIDLHYWQTVDLEWYDPRALTTQGGDLKISLSQKETHGMDYEGGHLSSWNKFCFTGGYIEGAASSTRGPCLRSNVVLNLANVSLPGNPTTVGLWPAIWMMGETNCCHSVLTL